MNTLINIIVTIILLPWGGIVIMSPMMIAAKGFKDSLSFILMGMLFLGYPVLVFLVLKLFGLKFYGTNVNGWLLGSSIIFTLIIFLYGIPGMLINLGKGIPGTGYYIGENAVYLDGRKIQDANPTTFTEIEIDRWYAKDAGHVYYDGRAIKGADPDTFVPVDLNIADSVDTYDDSPIFWKDHSHVYYKGEIIPKADAQTFEHLEGLYAKDRHHVYVQNFLLEGADPNKFHFLGKGIATDGSAIFIYQKRSNTKVDINSFEVIEHENDTYCQDKNHIYLLFYAEDDPLIKAEGVDRDTFTPLEASYARDKDHVYYYGFHRHRGQKLALLKEANPSTFSVGYDESTNSDANDGKHFYSMGKLIKP